MKYFIEVELPVLLEHLAINSSQYCLIATKHAIIKYYGKKTKATERLDLSAKCEEIIFFSFQSPCISWPCQNGATCAAHYEKNSYVCVCAKGYTGKYCERGNVLAM